MHERSVSPWVGFKGLAVIVAIYGFHMGINSTHYRFWGENDAQTDVLVPTLCTCVGMQSWQTGFNHIKVDLDWRSGAPELTWFCARGLMSAGEILKQRYPTESDEIEMNKSLSQKFSS